MLFRVFAGAPCAGDLLKISAGTDKASNELGRGSKGDATRERSRSLMHKFPRRRGGADRGAGRKKRKWHFGLAEINYEPRHDVTAEKRGGEGRERIKEK